MATLHARADVLIAPATPCPAFPLGVADWDVAGTSLPIRLGIGMFTQALTSAAQHITAQTGLDARIAAGNAESDPAALGALHAALNTFMATEMLPVVAAVNTFLPVAVSAALAGV